LKIARAAPTFLRQKWAGNFGIFPSKFVKKGPFCPLAHFFYNIFKNWKNHKKEII